MLRHIHAQLPDEHVLYFADAAFSPYGEKTDEWLAQRSLEIAHFLVRQGVKALVVACNTATGAAIKELRKHYPELPIVGVEPGLKPASAATRSGKVGVLATEAALTSDKFLQLRDHLTVANGTRFVLQGCPGLANAVDRGELATPATVELLRGFIEPVLAQGADTLVLGCTHYPFVQQAIEGIVAGRDVKLIDTGEAVARQLARLLEGAGLRRPGGTPAHLRGYTSGSAAVLQQAFASLLGLRPTVESVQLGGA